MLHVQNLRKRVKQNKKRIEDLVAKNKKLRKENAYKRMAEMDNEEVLAQLKNRKHRKIPKNQMHLIQEILNSSKNPRARRYKEGWMLLCMLLHIRSPAGYNYLRSSEILPLPVISTIRR